jgi:type II secretory pathway pseudopilin PulG
MVSSNKGLTLVEVIVAAALVTVIIVSLGAAITQSAVFSNQLDITYSATYLAQRRVDLLKRFQIDQLYPEALETDVRIDESGNINSTGYFARTTSITENYGGYSNLVKVKVSVKRIRVSQGGATVNASGQVEYVGSPIVIETLFTDV